MCFRFPGKVLLQQKFLTQYALPAQHMHPGALQLQRYCNSGLRTSSCMPACLLHDGKAPVPIPAPNPGIIAAEPDCVAARLQAQAQWSTRPASSSTSRQPGTAARPRQLAARSFAWKRTPFLSTRDPSASRQPPLFFSLALPIRSLPTLPLLDTLFATSCSIQSSASAWLPAFASQVLDAAHDYAGNLTARMVQHLQQAFMFNSSRT